MIYQLVNCHHARRGFLRFAIETTIRASIEEVWQAWTTRDDITQWNAASEDWHCPAAEIDLRSGGTSPIAESTVISATSSALSRDVCTAWLTTGLGAGLACQDLRRGTRVSPGQRQDQPTGECHRSPITHRNETGSPCQELPWEDHPVTCGVTTIGSEVMEVDARWK